MPWFSFGVSALCVEEAALVTAGRLFIGVEAIPEPFCHLSVPEIPGVRFPLGMLQGCSVDPSPQESGTLLCLFMTLQPSSALGSMGARAPASLILEVLFLEVPALARRAGVGGSRSHYLGS